MWWLDWWYPKLLSDEVNTAGDDVNLFEEKIHWERDVYEVKTAFIQWITREGEVDTECKQQVDWWRDLMEFLTSYQEARC